MSSLTLPDAMEAVVYDFVRDKFLPRNDLPVPQPGRGEVLVQVHACGLNPVDAKISRWQGLVAASERGDGSFVPGLDVTGTVVRLGADASTLRIGDTVLYHGRMVLQHGGLAEYAVADALTALRVPSAWTSVYDLPSLAAIPCAAWTAWQVVTHKLHVKASDVLLVYGATGGVGSFVVQFAAKLGVKRIIGVCSKRNAAVARRLGCTDVVDYTDRHVSVSQAVRKLTGGRGVDKAVDLVGADTAAVCADLLAFQGILCPAVSTADPSRTENAFGRALTFAQVSLGAAHRNGEAARRLLVADATAAMKMIVDNQLTVPISRCISLRDAPVVLREMLDAHTTGKIVVNVSPAPSASPSSC